MLVWVGKGCRQLSSERPLKREGGAAGLPGSSQLLPEVDLSLTLVDLALSLPSGIPLLPRGASPATMSHSCSGSRCPMGEGMALPRGRPALGMPLRTDVGAWLVRTGGPGCGLGGPLSLVF